jgi:hypothetical protein
VNALASFTFGLLVVGCAVPNRASLAQAKIGPPPDMDAAKFAEVEVVRKIVTDRKGIVLFWNEPFTKWSFNKTSNGTSLRTIAWALPVVVSFDKSQGRQVLDEIWMVYFENDQAVAFSNHSNGYHSPNNDMLDEPIPLLPPEQAREMLSKIEAVDALVLEKPKPEARLIVPR